MLPDLLINTTLVWEPAAVFYDLLIAVFKSLVPLVVFIIYIMVTFIFLFYTFGQHQLIFDYYTDINMDDMEGGIVREYAGPNAYNPYYMEHTDPEELEEGQKPNPNYDPEAAEEAQARSLTTI